MEPQSILAFVASHSLSTYIIMALLANTPCFLTYNLIQAIMSSNPSSVHRQQQSDPDAANYAQQY